MFLCFRNKQYSDFLIFTISNQLEQLEYNKYERVSRSVGEK